VSASTSPRIAAAARGPSGLVYVVWELTLRCDHACNHCGSRAGKARDDELSTEEALDVVQQLAAMGAFEVTLIGGEAYLRDDWAVIAAAIVRSGIRCSMTTGGRGLTTEHVAAAKTAGMQNISVSVDGLAPAHDTLPGIPGSFDSAIAAIRRVRAAGVVSSVNTQINHLSFPYLDDLLDLWIELGVTGWQMQLTVPMGRAADHPEWLMQPYELAFVYPKLAELARRGV
jgi:MoaA/NifB/PqqE/SkfB family radical SAM enzyme